MRFFRMCAIVLARFFISAVFLAGAVGKILNWHDTEKNLMNTLCDWQGYIGFSESAQGCIATITPWTPLLLIVATLCELIGGLLVLLGIKEKLGAGLLILVLIPVTILMHQFWFVDGSARELQTIMFLKNLAIIGGLIMIVLHGAQAKSGGGGDSFPPMKFG